MSRSRRSLSLSPLSFVALSAALVLAFAAAPAAAADSMTGEVLDLGCYENGQSGASHASCAKRCLGRGGALGLLVDGEVYEIDVEASDEAAVKTMREKGGENVTVKGQAADEDGKKTLAVQSAEPAG